MTTTALILHRVEDYNTWHSAYDSLEGLRSSHGVVADEVLAPLNGDNLVAITHDFQSPESAQAYLSSPELQGAMAKAGVDHDSIEVRLFQRARGASAARPA